jgi:hypothetical protein
MTSPSQPPHPSPPGGGDYNHHHRHHHAHSPAPPTHIDIRAQFLADLRRLGDRRAGGGPISPLSDHHPHPLHPHPEILMMDRMNKMSGSGGGPHLDLLTLGSGGSSGDYSDNLPPRKRKVSHDDEQSGSKMVTVAVAAASAAAGKATAGLNGLHDSTGGTETTTAVN